MGGTATTQLTLARRHVLAVNSAASSGTLQTWIWVIEQEQKNQCMAQQKSHHNTIEQWRDFIVDLHEHSSSVQFFNP